MTRSAWILVILSAWLWLEGAANAEEPPVKSAVIERVGFAGRFKVGCWTPLAVRLETDRACQGELEVEVDDPDGNRAVWSHQFQVDSAGSHLVSLLFQAGRLKVTLKPRLSVTVPGGEETWTIPVSQGDRPQSQFRHAALTHATLLVGTIGNPGGLSPGDDSTLDELSGNREPVVIAELKDPAEFLVADAGDPSSVFTNASGLEAVDTIVVSGQYDMSQEESDALKTWVTLGGHLVLSVGRELEAYEKSPLSKWVSGSDAENGNETFRLAGKTTILRLDTLENYAGKDSERILINRQNPVIGIKIEPGNGTKTELTVLSGPLIVRAPYGMGTVTFLGLSLSDEPIRSWPSLPRALRKLLWDTQPPVAGSSATMVKQLAHSGISEFATQLKTALVAFPSVERLSTWSVIGLMTAYLLIIGPLDYFVVHYLLKRPRLTWVTLPVWIAGAAFLSAWMAKSQNGKELMVSQVDVLDYDESTRTMRSRTWASLYSPESRRYHVSLKPTMLAGGSGENAGVGSDVRMSWFGTPESSFGGMYRDGGQQIQPPKYRFSPEAESFENLPIPIWGAKSLKSEWCRQGTIWVESELESPRPGQLRGKIQHQFPVPIKDWFVAYNSRVFLPRANPTTGESDPLPPETVWPPNDPLWDRVRQREIGGFLTRTVAKQSRQKDGADVPSILREQQPYNPLAKANPDPMGDIFRILSFHHLTGGKSYTGLDNYFFRGMDLSDRLKQEQAVLFGRLDLPAAELQIQDHEPQQKLQATFVRIVLPVWINHGLQQMPPELRNR